MDYVDIQPLVNTFHRKLAATDLRFKRYLYGRINWNVRLIGIKGARGVGKTTLLLQHIKETFSTLDEVLYVSLDNMWFNNHSLEELVEFPRIGWYRDRKRQPDSALDVRLFVLTTSRRYRALHRHLAGRTR